MQFSILLFNAVVCRLVKKWLLYVCATLEEEWKLHKSNPFY